MKLLTAAIDAIPEGVQLNQNRGFLWTPDADAIGDTTIAKTDLLVVPYDVPQYYVDGTKEMHEQLEGTRIAVLGAIPEGVTEFAFHMATATRDNKNDAGKTTTNRGDRKVVLVGVSA